MFTVHCGVYNERMVDEASAVRALSEVLGSMDVVRRVAEPETDQGADLEVELVDGETFLAEVRSFAHPTTTELEGLVRRWRPNRFGHVRILVADAVPEQARPALARAGISFLDRRGHLVLVGPGILVQSDVPALPRAGRPAPKGGIRGESGIAVALALLLRPDEPPGVREMQRISGLSVGAISKARGQLQDARLVDVEGRPLVPELFWALAEEWAPAMADLPVWPGGAERADALALEQRFRARLDVPLLEGIEEALAAYRPGRPSEGRDPHSGWALTGTLAAATYGADVVAGAGAVPEVLVPEDAWHLIEGSTAPPVPGRQPVARMAVAPTRLAVLIRRPAAGPSPFPRAHPLVVALDLARDPGRGREILSTFDPEDCHVVWR